MDPPEATGESKQVLEYYKLYGRDRDIKQYLALPLTTDLDSANENVYRNREENIARTTLTTVDECNASETENDKTHKSEENSQKKLEENEAKSNPINEQNIITEETSTCTRSVTTKISAKSKNEKRNKEDFVLNIESQIEINYEMDIPQSGSNEETQRQVKFDKMTYKPKGILKVDEGLKQKVQIENTEVLPSPTSSVASNRRLTVSPTSSVASNKRLEWDSLADVGYNNTDEIFSKYPLSTLERIALDQRHKSQYNTKKDDFKAPSTSNKPEEKKMIPIVAKITKMRKDLGKPKAESTPILPKIDSSEYLEEDVVVNVKSEDDIINQPEGDMKKINRRKILKQCKSLNDIHSKAIITADKVDKYIQTSLPRDSTLQNTPTGEFCEEQTDEKISVDKENIKRTPIKNKYRSRMLRKQRISRRKLASSTQFQIDCEDENSGEKNALEVLRSDSRFNISQSSVGTNMNTISQPGENHGISAESFEYMAGNSYKPGPENNPDRDNTSSLANSDASLKRSRKLEDVSNISTSKSNDSSSSKNGKKPSSTSCTNDETSSNCDRLFGEAKFSTLNRDIKTSVRLLNSLITNNKGNMELKKKMVKKFVKRLLEANYGDDTTTVDSSTAQSKSKESQSSNVIHSTIDSTGKSSTFSTSASPDPSYSLPEHLIANVPWKPSKFSQGIDYIRVPTTQTKDYAVPSNSQKEPKYKSIYTMPHRIDKKYSSTSTSNSMDSFKDLVKEKVKSPEKIKLLNEQQQILQQNLVKQQICSEQTQHKLDNSNDVLIYAKKEKENQLAWISSEIQHLNYLKMVLENQSGKNKFDTPKETHVVSAQGDAKFDTNFFADFGNIPNRNIVYPIITNLEQDEEGSKKDENVSFPSSSTQIDELDNKKEDQDKSSSRSQYENLKYRSKGKITTSISETNTSSTSTKKTSIREQIKELTRNIELLKQSTQFSKNASCAHSSQSMYTEYDSHINTSRRYSEVIYIHDSKSSSQGIRPAEKSSQSSDQKSKSSSIKTSVGTNQSISKNLIVEKKKALEKLSGKSESVGTTRSSGTHTSLKSATISINGQNVLSKSTEQSPSSFAVDPAWEMYLKRKFEKKPELQTISTQTSSHLLIDDKIVKGKISSCVHCQKCSCKCKTSTERKSKSKPKPKELAKPVAYVLTFENESTPSTSSKPSKKSSSLDEIRIKLPYNRENKTKSSKSRRTKKDVNDNKKANKTEGKTKKSKSQKHESFDESSDLRNNEIENIINKNDDMVSKKKSSNSSSSGSTIKNNTSASSSIVCKCEETPDSSEQIISEKSSNSISTMISTSTDSFIMEGKPKPKSEEEKAHKPTVQECLVLYKSDFVRKAEKRRDIINKISELRSQRNAQRKQLLQLINDDKPDHRNEIINVKKMLPQPPKPPRIFTSKEIRDMSRKKYRKLPEVTQRKKDMLRNNLYRNNRFIASIFNKKLQTKVLQGKLTLSNSISIVNGYD